MPATLQSIQASRYSMEAEQTAQILCNGTRPLLDGHISIPGLTTV